jgi:hypothetical protein
MLSQTSPDPRTLQIKLSKGPGPRARSHVPSATKGNRVSMSTFACMAALWKLLSPGLLAPDYELMKDSQDAHIFVQGCGFLTMCRS